MQKRTLKELNLLDDFLFGSMVTYPEIGEQFVRTLLRIIFARDIRTLKVIPQKVYYGSDTDRHGARTLFLYTRGTKGDPPEALRQLLHYMEHTTQQNACSQDLQKIQKMVDIVKQDEEVSLKFMKIFEREEMLLNQGRDEGRKEERNNTERERQRADTAAAQAREANERAALAEEEIRRLKEKIELLEKQ